MYNTGPLDYFDINTPPGAKLGLCRSTIYSKFLIAHQIFHWRPLWRPLWSQINSKFFFEHQIFLWASKFFFEHQILTFCIQVYMTSCKMYLSLYFCILVESRSWRDQNLKFGPNCDLETEAKAKWKKDKYGRKYTNTKTNTFCTMSYTPEYKMSQI